jgi:hypothetical protein
MNAKAMFGPYEKSVGEEPGYFLVPPGDIAAIEKKLLEDAALITSQAERIKQLDEAGRKFKAAMNTCRLRNTSEWMDYWRDQIIEFDNALLPPGGVG